MQQRTNKKEKEEEKIPDQSKRTFSYYMVWVVKNVVCLLSMIWLLNYTFTNQPGYKWVYEGLLKGNMEEIKQNPSLSFEQKMLIKLGDSYNLLYYIREHTPPNAVILYPTSSDFRQEGNPFKHEIYNKTYATRFLYPRKLVTVNELGTSPYTNQITHVAIVNGQGLERVPYPVDAATKHGIFPVK